MDNDNDFFVYVLPISGGAIVSHLALLQEIYDARILAMDGKKRGYFSYSPNLVLGSSGGNISAFIGLASDWESSAIYRNVDYVDSKLFMKRWISKDIPLIPSLPFVFLNGTLYNSGMGARSFFRNLFTQESITRTELWSGTYDKKHQKAQFFCNKSQAESYISQPFFNEEQQLYSSLPLRFTNGNIDELSDVCIASGTIPGIIPSKIINGIPYDDGGIMYASPLTVFSKELYRIITGVERVATSNSYRPKVSTEENEEFVYHEKDINTFKRLRLIYFYPYQPNELLSAGKSESHGITSYLNSLLKVAMLQDRNAGLELLNSLSNGNVVTETIIRMDTKILAEKIKMLSSKKHYLICLYPHGNPNISIKHLNGDVTRREMQKVKNSYGCQIWYSKD